MRKRCIVSRIHAHQAFSLMELLVAVFIIGIVMGTIYFSLDNLRLVFRKEQAQNRSYKQMEKLFYQFSLWAGRAKLLNCSDRELEIHFSQQEIYKTNGKPKQNRNKDQFSKRRIETQMLLTKTSLNNKVHYFLHKKISFFQGQRKIDTIKKNDYLFFSLPGTGIENAQSGDPSLSLNINQENTKQMKPMSLDWQCRQLRNGQPFVQLKAWKQVSQNRIKFRQRAFLLAWQKPKKD